MDEKFSLATALRKLELYRGRWLLLVDGANYPDEMSGLWPPGTRGDIIYTSRNMMLRKLPPPQVRHVLEMDKDEATSLLLKSAHLDTNSQLYITGASIIVEELGCLALAVDQAGAYIANSMCDLDNFLDVFRSHRHELLQNEAYQGAGGPDRAVYTTWDLSVKAIEKQANSSIEEGPRQGAKAALKILQIFPFFHNESILEEIFKCAAENTHAWDETGEQLQELSLTDIIPCPNGRWENFTFRQGVRTLLSFSLIRRDRYRPIFSMHPLVHLWAFDRMTRDEQDRFGDVAFLILSNSFAWKFEVSDYAFRRRLLPHVIAFQKRQPFFTANRDVNGISRISRVFEEAGRWHDAEELRTRILEKRKSVLGADHPNTLINMGNLALVYREQGRYTEAEQLERQVLEKRKVVKGADHSDTIASMARLVSVYLEQGRWTEAEELETEVLKNKKAVLGAEHPDTLVSMGNLAYVYREQGRLTEAEQLEKEVLGKKKAILGAEHPETLFTTNNLALVHQNQGRWTEAEQLQKQVLEQKKAVLGAEHPSTLTGMHNLAHILHGKGDYQEAVLLMKQCVELRLRVNGPDHPDTKLSLECLSEWEQEGHQRPGEIPPRLGS